MNETVRAIVLKAPRLVSLVELPAPELKRGDILVEMKACGLCGSDVEKINGEYTSAPPVLGHEAVGVVLDPNDVEGLRRGERIFPHHHVPCYECHFCRSGSETMCPHYRMVHLDPCGFADRFRVPAWIVDHGGVLSLPSEIGFEEGSFIEPTACCVRSLRRVGFRAGETALVVGAGPIGLTHIMLLKASGASKVFASEPSAVRLRQAEIISTDPCFNPALEDVPSKVRSETGGRGVDLAVVASGSPKAIVQALRSVRNGGRVCLFGVPFRGSTLEYDVSELVTSEVSVISSNAATEEDTREAAGLIASGKIGVKSLVTHRIPLHDFSRAVELAGRTECIKCIITP